MRREGLGPKLFILRFKMADEEEDLIKYFFYRGYEYKEIIYLLKKEHDINLSLSTFKRRLKKYNLSRHKADYDVEAVRGAIIELLSGPSSSLGYRSIWHSLQIKGMRIPRIVVQKLVKELDPEGVESRRAHRLRRREYFSPGPNSVWHADGYDKLKPYGLPIHGCIDGYSRKIIWLYVTRSNNLPDNIAAYYLDGVREFGGCPMELNTDLGTENGIMAGIHSYFRENPDSHKYVASPRNQRIEGWWSFLRKNWSSWWIALFKDMIEQEILNTGDHLQIECLWFCFSDLIQKELNEIKELWNTHYIRKSRFDTVCGRPDSLYSMPEFHGGVDNLIRPVDDMKLNYAYSHLVEAAPEEQGSYQEYFQYVMDALNLEKNFKNWSGALELYGLLCQVAKNDS